MPKDQVPENFLRVLVKRQESQNTLQRSGMAVVMIAGPIQQSAVLRTTTPGWRIET